MKKSLQTGLVASVTLIVGTFTTLTTMAVGVAQVPVSRSETIGFTFDQQEVDQSKFIAVAVPLAIGHKLVILEQLSATQLCWRETGTQPVRVDPLLLKFDFTGICGRSTDSNHYSIHQAGQDLALYYSLKIEQHQGELVLLASPYPGYQGQAMEIGRTRGISSEAMKIILDPGWRFTKRTFDGQVLDHVYLTQAGESLSTLTSTPMLTPTPGPTPTAVPTPTPTPMPPNDTQPPDDTQPSTDGGEFSGDDQPASPGGDESSGRDQSTSGGKPSPGLIERILGPVQQILPFLIPLL